MKQFAILLLSIFLLSCSEKKQQQANADISDTTKNETYIEKYIREEIDFFAEKLEKDFIIDYDIEDSIKVKSLNATLYYISTKNIIDDHDYLVIRDNKTNDFYKCTKPSWSFPNSKIPIDLAYKILSLETNTIEPVEYHLQGVENFINHSDNSKRSLTIQYIDTILNFFYKNENKKCYSKIDIQAVVDSINKVNYSPVKNIKSKELVDLLSKRLNNKYISIYNVHDCLLYVELNPIMPIEQYLKKERDTAKYSYDDLRNFKPEGVHNLRFIRIW
ncbi:MAG: hypothetical protein ACXWW0_09660 [Bacteroidia bacterium]